MSAADPTTLALAERAEGCRENAGWWQARAEVSDDPDGARIMAGWAADWHALAGVAAYAAARYPDGIEPTGAGLPGAIDRLAARLETP